MLNKETFTKNQIVAATIKLLKEKDHTQISISEIIKLSKVSRASFYRSFKSIEDVLAYQDKKLIKEYTMNYEIKNDTGYEILFYEISKFYKKNKSFYIVVVNQGLSKIIIDSLFINIDKLASENKNLNAYAKTFLSFGIYGTIVTWIKNGMKESPESIYKYLKDYRTKYNI